MAVQRRIYEALRDLDGRDAWEDTFFVQPEPWTPEDACLQGAPERYQRYNSTASNALSSLESFIPWSNVERGRGEPARVWPAGPWGGDHMPGHEERAAAREAARAAAA